MLSNGPSLRYYQREAVDAVFEYWREEPGHPLVDMATGTGKSLTMAKLTEELITGWPDMRVVSVTHVVELVESNYRELVGLWPFAPAGIYAAALSRRDRHAQILFAQLQTVWNKVDEIGHVDVLEIDEVHLVPANENTMYQAFIGGLMAINPDMKIVGFSATPYRLDSGRLDEGDDRLFDRVVYEYGIRRGIEDGYLARLTSKPTATGYDMSGVHRLGGDFKRSELAAAVDRDQLTKAAVAEVIKAAEADNRKCALFFCAGIEHAMHVRDEVRLYGRTCETISGKTPAGERRRIIDGLKHGDIWGVTNDNVMSTGTNVPRIDLIADMAPTASASRFVQRGGRGTRPLYAPGRNLDTVEGRLAAIADGPKPNCLYMNFAQNIERHGPIDMVEPKKPGKGQGEAPIKLCPNCDEICHASVRVCPQCGHQFEFDETPKITAAPTGAPILSSDEPNWIEVSSRTFAQHDKIGKPPSVKITYQTASGAKYNSWVCPQHGEDPHGGRAKSTADRWWHTHGGNRPFPKTVSEFLDRVAAGELLVTSHVTISKSGKYWNVDQAKAGDVRDTTFVKPDPSQGNIAAARYQWPTGALDDDIPF